jgi:hypothetical protein
VATSETDSAKSAFIFIAMYSSHWTIRRRKEHGKAG